MYYSRETNRRCPKCSAIKVRFIYDNDCRYKFKCANCSYTLTSADIDKTREERKIEE